MVRFTLTIPSALVIASLPGVASNIDSTAQLAASYRRAAPLDPLSFRFNRPSGAVPSSGNLDFDSILASTKSWASATKTAARKFMQGPSDQNISEEHGASGGTLFQAFPALTRRQEEARSLLKTIEVVATKTPMETFQKNIAQPFQKNIAEPFTKELSEAGVYFGLAPKTVIKAYDQSNAGTQKKRVDLRESMGEALEELRIMRHEMETLRKEMQQLQRQMGGIDEDELVTESLEELSAKKKKRKREMEKISIEVEEWAKQLMSEQFEMKNAKKDLVGDVEWNEIPCTKMLQSKFNANGQTRAYLTYMKDSRGKHADPNDDQEYPCIKMYSTIDAPIEDVCVYLSMEKHMSEYNSLIEKNKDLEEVSPHSKICWGQTPQVLFLKPKEFVTYCHFKWLKDGTQAVINQAVDHEQQSASAYALRGATFIRRHPDDPDGKTQISVLAHGNPGADVPAWAIKTAVKSLAPIEPFRFFHKINEGVRNSREEVHNELRKINDEMHTEMVNSSSTRNPLSRLPGGLACLGYACFWPKGGGQIEQGVGPQQVGLNLLSNGPVSESGSQTMSIDENKPDQQPQSFQLEQNHLPLETAAEDPLRNSSGQEQPNEEIIRTQPPSAPKLDSRVPPGQEPGASKPHPFALPAPVM